MVGIGSRRTGVINFGRKMVVLIVLSTLRPNRGRSRMALRDRVSTGSGSDRVIALAYSTVGWIETRALLLPVLTRRYTIAALFMLTLTAHAQVKVTIDHNSNTTATSAFKFNSVPSPAREDAATRAQLLLVEGEVDGNGADLSALTDGALPLEADRLTENFSWTAATG